jgi:hypothetical protein
MSNPYEVPNPNSPPSETVKSDLRYLRLVLMLHLWVIGYFATGTLLERGTFEVSPLVLRIWNIPVLQLFMMLVSSACPLAMIFLACRLRGRSRGYRILIIAGEFVLVVFQMWVMLPAVS